MSIKTLMQNIKSEVIEKHDFENQDVINKGFLWKLWTTGIRRKEPNRWLFKKTHF